MEKSFSEQCVAECLLLNELEENARKIVLAYAESDNADADKIPTLYKAMVQAQIDVRRR